MEMNIIPANSRSHWKRLCGAFFLGVFLLFAAKSPAGGWVLPQEPQEPPVEKEDDNSFDPVRAATDMDVGDFYFRRGSYDAAILRYQDATRHKPNFALAYYKLGLAYDKKHDKTKAIEAYKKYLEILPKGSYAKHCSERIEKLGKQT
jgi:tetratricopeptide (TPR) repeat protein